MLSKELRSFIEDELDYLSARHGEAFFDEREKVAYANIVKLNEEVGELCEAILASYDRQTNKKDKSFDVAGEMADVIIVLLILAEYSGIDIDEALRAKIEKVKKRRKLS